MQVGSDQFIAVPKCSTVMSPKLFVCVFCCAFLVVCATVDASLQVDESCSDNTPLLCTVKPTSCPEGDCTHILFNTWMHHDSYRFLTLRLGEVLARKRFCLRCVDPLSCAPKILATSDDPRDDHEWDWKVLHVLIVLLCHDFHTLIMNALLMN